MSSKPESERISSGSSRASPSVSGSLAFRSAVSMRTKDSPRKSTALPALCASVMQAVSSRFA